MVRLLPVLVLLALRAAAAAHAQECTPHASRSAVELTADAISEAGAAPEQANYAEPREPRSTQLPIAYPAPVRDEELPWCTSSEDPRCSPLHTNTSAAASDTRSSAATPSGAAVAPLRIGTCMKLSARLGLAPEAGISHRVERPPRVTAGNGA